MMHAKRNTSVGALVVIATLLVVVFSASATERSADEVSRITRQISQEIYSPYCPGKNLAMCPSSNALDARMEIQRYAAQGMEAEEIKAIFYERYGEEVAMVPPPAQDNFTLLGLIFGGLILAVVAVRFLGRRRRSGDGEEDEEAPGGSFDQAFEAEADEEYLDELRAEYND